MTFAALLSALPPTTAELLEQEEKEFTIFSEPTSRERLFEVQYYGFRLFF